MKSIKAKNFFLKIRPSRPTAFSIFERIEYVDGTTLDETIQDNDLKDLNVSYKAKRLSLDEAKKSAKSILKRIKSQNNLINPLDEIFNSENTKILTRFLEDYFKRKKFLVDKDSARYKFERAIRALGALSIQSATDDEMLTKIMNLPEKSSSLREKINKLNTILKYLKRDVTIGLPPEEIEEVKYLSEDEVLLVARQLNDERLKNLCLLAFYSGLRIGETLAINSNSLRADGTIYVEAQIDKHGKRRLPKNRKRRSAFLIESGVVNFRHWTKLLPESDLTRNKINKRFKSACRAVFKDKSKHCKWHDLRHSYAIFLLTKGVPIQLVAQSMGNSVSVCEKHYAGFVLTDVGISAINNILTPKENKTNNEPTKKQSHLKIAFSRKE